MENMHNMSVYDVSMHDQTFTDCHDSFFQPVHVMWPEAMGQSVTTTVASVHASLA